MSLVTLPKNHRSSLSPRNNKWAEFAFDLVHSNIWGPCRVMSKVGLRYIFTFFDDFSRMTWIYFMKNRSEVFFHFSNFCAEIKTQFNVSIHIFRSDNAKEFMSTSSELHESIWYSSSIFICGYTLIKWGS